MKYRVQGQSARLRRGALATVTALLLAGAGCAIQYTDSDTGTVHLFGFGHLSAQTAPPIDAKMPEAKTATVIGIGIGIDEEDLSFIVGFSRRQRMKLIDPNTAIRVDATGLLIPIPTAAKQDQERKAEEEEK